MARVSLHVGADWWVHLSAYENRTPILDVDAGGTSVSFTVASSDAADDAAVEFARLLATSTAAFAAEVERIHAKTAKNSNGGGGAA
jgi:hypothetical protein